ncbi:MAG: hypothetical protein AAF826_08990 [Pseudomonadota bacterium]
MNSPLIKRATHRPAKGQAFIHDITLLPARAHEFCGPSRRSLALMLAARMEGPVYWIVSHWETDQLHAPGVTQFINPSRIRFVRPKRLEDLLWCTEEVLRAGCIPLVITELPEPPPLTPVRRLHLAAENAEHTGQAPLSILLTTGNGGAQGIESRWHMTPKHRIDQIEWRLTRRRARMAPEASFDVTWADGAAHLVKQAISA